MLKVSGRTSTKIGVAPASTTASAVAVKVNDGTNTASPRPTSLAISAMIRAVVPLEQEITCLAPQWAASFFSISATSGPMMNPPWSSTRPMAASSRVPRRWRWACKSTMPMA